MSLPWEALPGSCRSLRAPAEALRHVAGRGGFRQGHSPRDICRPVRGNRRTKTAIVVDPVVNSVDARRIGTRIFSDLDGLAVKNGVVMLPVDVKAKRAQKRDYR